MATESKSRERASSVRILSYILAFGTARLIQDFQQPKRKIVPLVQRAVGGGKMEHWRFTALSHGDLYLAGGHGVIRCLLRPA